MRSKSAMSIFRYGRIRGANALRFAILLAPIAGSVVITGNAQTLPTAAPQQKQFTPERLPPGWDQIDERLVFLTIRLSSVETSVDAVNKAIKATGYSKSIKAEDVEHARKGNEIMDRKGGGPVPWQDFYGRTATDFYFHPGTTVHGHVISGNLREADIQAQHSDKPIAIDRPPQLDYIYRANLDNQKRAEQAVAELGGKIEKLLDRRRALESEQSALWSEIAFQAVASRDLSSKPLYRFNLKSTQQDQPADHVAAAGAACDFVRTVNQLMGDAQNGVENDPGQVFHQFSIAISAARKTLDDRLAEQESIALDLSDGQAKISKVAAVAKRLDDLAKNLDESYRLACEGDAAGDEQRKNTFRGLLQDGFLNTSDTLVTADHCVLDVVKDWKLTTDVKNPATQPSAHIESPPKITIAAEVSPPKENQIQKPFAEADLMQKLAGTKWHWPDHTVKDPWFTLNADGTIRAGWHKIPGSWVVTSSSTIVAVIRASDRTPEKFEIHLGPDASLTGERGELCKQIVEQLVTKKSVVTMKTASSDGSSPDCIGGGFQGPMKLNPQIGLYADEESLKRRLSVEEMEIVKGLHIGKIYLAENPDRFTFFKLNVDIDNQTPRGRIEGELSVDSRVLCIDSDGKPNVTKDTQRIDIGVKGSQRVSLGTLITLKTIKIRNNNNAVPANAYVSFRLGDVEFYRAFLTPPSQDEWWLKDELLAPKK